jgi:hypothetical protein
MEKETIEISIPAKHVWSFMRFAQERGADVELPTMREFNSFPVPTQHQLEMVVKVLGPVSSLVTVLTGIVTAGKFLLSYMNGKKKTVITTEIQIKKALSVRAEIGSARFTVESASSTTTKSSTNKAVRSPKKRKK